MQGHAHSVRGLRSLQFQRIVIDFVICIKWVSRNTPDVNPKTVFSNTTGAIVCSFFGLVKSPLLIVPSLPNLVDTNPMKLLWLGFPEVQFFDI